MAVNIGLIIWKEIKARSIQRDQFAEDIGISLHKLNKIIKETSVDTEILARMSAVLEINLFEYFIQDEELNSFHISQKQVNINERKQLLDLLDEKNELIRLKDATIKNQARAITILEAITKGQAVNVMLKEMKQV
ncbi:helix-turn-helix domain-containing protein [Pedobacter miscanthi]|uniref:helix-turn-helix domain-containing protein n=1 Tax=Pedobacter miscanthi TaxID=2259170 RepID=UPI002931A43B|nr:helix-turn-helix domain-containing protein [Pedobacter miscanthi]